MKFALLCLALTLTACHGSKMAGDKATNDKAGQNEKISERQKVEAFVNKVNANTKTASAKQQATGRQEAIPPLVHPLFHRQSA